MASSSNMASQNSNKLKAAPAVCMPAIESCGEISGGMALDGGGISKSQYGVA
jgi:hypothetical protein